jgi:teichuronic acid biosynthesis glycosyltransferase TuaH
VPSRDATDSVVLALAYHTWADGVRRQWSWSPDRVAHHLVEDERVAAVVVADPLRSHAARLRRRNRDPRIGFPDDPTRWLLQPRRWRRHDTDDLRRGVRAYRRLDDRLARDATDRGLARPVLVSCHPLLAAVAGREHWSDVVYYGWDDWLTYPLLASAHEQIAWSYAQMAARDVKVIGVTQAIVERVGAPRSAVVPNGISIADHDGAGLPPAWFDAVPGPVALYAGSLENRIDVDALERLALDLPTWNLVLVGPLLEPELFARLKAMPNVHVHDREERPAVLAMMAAADVCLVAHRRTPMTEAMSPLKLFEYLASGAAVVATDLQPMRGVSDRCLLVEPGEPLAPAVLAAARLPRVSDAELACTRAEHDWSSRYRDWRAAALGG